MNLDVLKLLNYYNILYCLFANWIYWQLQIRTKTNVWLTWFIVIENYSSTVYSSDYAIISELHLVADFAISRSNLATPPFPNVRDSETNNRPCASVYCVAFWNIYVRLTDTIGFEKAHQSDIARRKALWLRSGTKLKRDIIYRFYSLITKNVIKVTFCFNCNV